MADDNVIDSDDDDDEDDNITINIKDNDKYNDRDKIMYLFGEKHQRSEPNNEENHSNNVSIKVNGSL